MNTQRLFLTLLAVTAGLQWTGALDHPARGANTSPVRDDTTVSGFVHPESVAYDAGRNVLYVGQFGSVLSPTLKDGKGKISKVSLQGKILEDRFLPAVGEKLNKPKGIWVRGSRLWVADIDVVWVFDLQTRHGKKALLAGSLFANDVTVTSDTLFVSDTWANRIYKVEPADFLASKGAPAVTVCWEGLRFSPNGLYPSLDGALLAVGFSAGHDQGIYSLNDHNGRVRSLVHKIGRLDGLIQLADGTILVTDWKSKSLIRWGPVNGIERLVSGFGGPADFCLVPRAKTITVVVPDLVKGELRIISLFR